MHGGLTSRSELGLWPMLTGTQKETPRHLLVVIIVLRVLAAIVVIIMVIIIIMTILVIIVIAKKEGALYETFQGIGPTSPGGPRLKREPNSFWRLGTMRLGS